MLATRPATHPTAPAAPCAPATAADLPSSTLRRPRGSDVGNPYTFTGRRLDAESPLMQYRHRYYDADLGRFITRDPAGYQEGYGLYVYAGARPGLATDPSGFAVSIRRKLLGREKLPPQQVIKDLQAARDTIEYLVPREGRKRVPELRRELGIAIGRVQRAQVEADVIDLKVSGLTGLLAELKGKVAAEVRQVGMKEFWKAFVEELSRTQAYMLQAEFIFAGGAGVGVLSCCDAQNRQHRTVFKKICIGPAGGFSVSVDAVWGLYGKDCPWGIKDWSYEVSPWKKPLEKNLSVGVGWSAAGLWFDGNRRSGTLRASSPGRSTQAVV